MSDAEFPTRTAGELTLPDKTVVWVQTLNTYLREQAQDRSNRYALAECREYLKGGKDYQAVIAQLKALEPEEQAAYLVQRNYGRIRDDALVKYPPLQEPDVSGLEPVAAGEALEDHRKKTEETDKQRSALEKELYEAEKQRYLELSVRARMDQCHTAYFGQRVGEYFVKRIMLETLLRAVRRSDDHTQRYFESIEQIEDLDDSVMDALTEFYYQQLDTVKPAEIPTRPADS